jgi:N utilization substance protein B
VRDRSRAREWALRVLYAWESREGTPLDQVLEEFMARRRIAASRRPYVRRLIDTIHADRDGIDRAVEEALTNWRLERLSALDRNVLRLAAAEMLHFEDVPPRVSIQEGVLLAEKYGTDQSPRFVNGVLDALMRRVDSA